MKKRELILVVIDSESEEMISLERAEQIANMFDAKIELFSAVFDPYIAGERLFDSVDLIASKTLALDNERERLEALAEPLRSRGFDVAVDVAWDEPFYEGVVRKTLRVNPRMVIRNNHYHSAIKRGFFSNDDWSLIRTCPAPLLITRPRRFDHKTLRVCAAVDPVHSSDKPANLDHRILKEALEITEQSGGDLTVLHVFDAARVIAALGAGTMMPIIPEVSSIEESVREEHREALDKLVKEYEINPESAHHLPGNPRAIIPAYVIDQEIDLLVMGAVSRGFFERHLIGNTAERILNQLPCDILVVKPDGFETKVSFETRHRFHPDPDITDVA